LSERWETRAASEEGKRQVEEREEGGLGVGI
jgi:hypothetical protein